MMCEQNVIVVVSMATAPIGYQSLKFNNFTSILDRNLWISALKSEKLALSTHVASAQS